MRIVYRGQTIMDVCEQQVIRISKNEPEALELVCETRGKVVRTNKKNHYRIEGKNAFPVEDFYGSEGERNEWCSQTDG
jgi:hypothetical protein